MDNFSKLSESIGVMADVKSLFVSHSKIVFGLGCFTIIRIPVIRIILKQYLLPEKIFIFSIRNLEILKIKEFCTQMQEPGSILIVSGEKGIGKTTAINTALYRFPTVYRIQINNYDQIINIEELVTKNILNTYRFSTIIGTPRNGLPRFIYWHNILLRRNPIIYIGLSRMDDENFNKYYTYFRNVRIIYLNSLLKRNYQ